MKLKIIFSLFFPVQLHANYIYPSRGCFLRKELAKLVLVEVCCQVAQDFVLESANADERFYAQLGAFCAGNRLLPRSEHQVRRRKPLVDIVLLPKRDFVDGPGAQCELVNGELADVVHLEFVRKRKNGAPFLHRLAFVLRIVPGSTSVHKMKR